MAKAGIDLAEQRIFAQTIHILKALSAISKDPASRPGIGQNPMHARLFADAAGCRKSFPQDTF
jgi:hypothetical protein